MKHWDKYDLGGVFDVFDFDKKMALINLDMIYEYAIKLDTIVTEESNLEEWVKMKLTRVEQNVSDVAHSLEGWEKFDEGGMIFKKQLLSISKYAHKLIEMIKGGSKLMSWQENKLAISANDIDNLYHHLDYKVGNRASQKKFATGGMMKYPDLSNETPIVINEPNNQKISEIDIALIDIALVRQDLGIEKTKIGSSDDAYQIFKQLWNKDSINVREEMNVLFLNNANEPIGYYEHTKGAINATLVDVEMIGALALKTLSKGVILAHNHPSGNNKPSEADIKLYQQVKTALKMFNVTVLDSMILVPNSDNYYSLADNGYEMGGMVLSNKEIIKNIDFSDNTDRRLGRYDFSFETEDSEGASILDYDGYIIEAPSSSRMNDEIEWGQNVPEDWENAEKYILDEFYNWKLKRFKNGGGVGEMTRNEIENKIDGLKLQLAKEKKRISAYEISERGKYNKLWQEKVAPLQKKLENLSELWGKSKYAKGGGIEVVGKGNKGAFRKREYDGMSENDVIGFWESRGYKISKTKSEGKLKPYTFYINKYANGGGVGSYNLDDEINKLYEKSGFINTDFNWKLKLLEMLQDQSIEAYNIYQKLSKEQKEDVLQEQFELDNDMGSYGDEDIKTSKQNLKIILEDAKNGKKYAKGGGVDYKIVAFPEAFMYKYFVVDEDNDNYLTVQEDMFDKWKNASKIEKAEYYSEWIPKNEMVEVMAKGGGVGEIKFEELVGNKFSIKRGSGTKTTTWEKEDLLEEIKGVIEHELFDRDFYYNWTDEGAEYYNIFDKYTLTPMLKDIDKTLNEYFVMKKTPYNNILEFKEHSKIQSIKELGQGYIDNWFKTNPHISPMLRNDYKKYREKYAGVTPYAKGGKINSGREAMFKSQEPHEQRYKRKREWKEYKKEGWFGDWYEMGGNVSSELSEPQKEFSKSAEMLVRENLQNGEICMCKLKKILGHEPNYPKQVIGSLVLEKAYLRNFYKI